MPGGVRMTLTSMFIICLGARLALAEQVAHAGAAGEGEPPRQAWPWNVKSFHAPWLFWMLNR